MWPGAAVHCERQEDLVADLRLGSALLPQRNRV